MLTVKDASEILGISKPRVYQLIESGVLSAEKFGSVWSISDASVEERKRSVKKTGRPKKTDKKNVRRYTLMAREHEVLDFSFDSEYMQFISIDEIKDLARAPIGITSVRFKVPSVKDLQYWWRHRSIPTSRPGIASKLEEFGYQSTSDVAIDTLGFSLTDQFWIKPENSNFTWNSINYFTNEFECVATDDNLLGGFGLKNPDNTSDGNLPKCWLCEGNQRFLLKGSGPLGQEAHNEVIATHLFSNFFDQDEYVRYETCDFNSRLVSKCKCFVSDCEEFVPAHYILKIKKKPNNMNWFEHYISCCEQLSGIDVRKNIEKMIVLDFVLMNFDRHYRNFGLIKNIEDLTWRLAPIFDSGSSLLCNVSIQSLKGGNAPFESKPFYEDPKRQLRLVGDMSWIDVDIMASLTNEIFNEFAGDETLKIRAPFIVDAVNKQIELLKLLK